jgi:hypothetical protein
MTVEFNKTIKKIDRFKISNLLSKFLAIDPKKDHERVVKFEEEIPERVFN